jgi:hypothetical protein
MSEDVVHVKGKGLARIVGCSEDGRTVFVVFVGAVKQKPVQVQSHEIEPYGGET